MNHSDRLRLPRRDFLLGASAGALLAGVSSTGHAATRMDDVDSPNGGMGWPQFLGPDGTGVVVENRGVPITWSKDQSIRWATQLAGSGWSSPVHDGQHIYVTASLDEADRDVRTLVIHKVNLHDGTLVATYPVFDQASDRDYPIHSKNSHASPTLVLDGDELVAHFGYQGTALLTKAGETIWQNRELVFPPTHGNGGSPLLLQDQIVFTCDGGDAPSVASLDRSTGDVLWRSPRPVDSQMKFSFCTPAAFRIDGQVQILAPGSGCVSALDPRTGEPLWTFESSGFSVVPKPMRIGNRFVYCTGFMSPNLIAIEPGREGNDWQPREAWRVSRNVPKTPTPIVDGDGIVMVSDEGIVTRVSVDDGEVVYRKRLGGNFSASPIRVGENIFLTNEDGVTTVIRSGDAYDELGSNDLAERTFATMAVAGDDLIVRTESTLYRIGV